MGSHASSLVSVNDAFRTNHTYVWLDFFCKEVPEEVRKKKKNKSRVSKGSKQKGSEQANCNFFAQELSTYEIIWTLYLF